MKSDRLIRWALFRDDWEKRFTMRAFGSSADAVQSIRLALFSSIKRRPDLTQRFKPSTLCVKLAKWTRIRQIEKRRDVKFSDDAKREVDRDPFFDTDSIVSSMRCLTYRERKIIEMRFGFGDGAQYTLSECGKVLGISAERVRSIESRAFRRMSKKLESLGWHTIARCKECGISWKLESHMSRKCDGCGGESSLRWVENCQEENA